VKKKVEESKIPKQMKEAVAKRAGYMASSRVKPAMIAKKMSAKLCQKMPENMKQAGLTVALEEVFREENYFVLELQVQHVDTVAVERKQRESNTDMTQDDNDTSSSLAGALLDWSLRLIGQDNQRRLEGDFLPGKVQQKLDTQMLEIMEEKFEDMQLKADVQILKEKRQARYFYSKLKAIRAEVEVAKGKNAIHDLRKKMSGEHEDIIEPTQEW